jgi:O-antigen/teichoic acid export membrane protein
MDQIASLEGMAILLIRLGLFWGVGMGSIAPFLVPIALGEGWTPVAGILQVLLIVFVVTFFTSPISSLLNVGGRQRGALGYYSLLTLARVLAVITAWWLRSEWLLVWAYALASLAVMLPLFTYIIRGAGASIRRILSQVRPLLVELICTIVVAALLSWVGWLHRWMGATLMAMLLLVVGALEVRRLRHRGPAIA